MMDQKLADAYFELYLKSDKFTAGTKNIQYSLKNLLGDVSKTALGFAGGLGLAQAIDTTRRTVVSAVKDYAKFQTGMREVSTLVNTQKVDIDRLGESVIELSNKYGKDKNGLAGSLYEAISAGIDAADSVKFLDVATKAAIGGVTETKVVVDGLTSILNAYGLSVDQAEDVSDALFTTVKIGKTKMEELAGSIGTVAPIASAVGLTVDDLGSSIATLTLTGLKTSEAMTALRSMLNNIIKPGDEARKLAEKLGIQLDVTAIKTEGFAKWLEVLREKTGGSSKALAVLLPDVQGLNAAIQLTGEGFDRYNSTMDDMQEKTGATTEATNKLEGSLTRLWETAGTLTKNKLSSGGNAISPLLGGILGVYNDIMQGAESADEFFNKLSLSGQDAAVRDYANNPTKSLYDISTLKPETLSEYINKQKEIIKQNKELVGTGYSQVNTLKYKLEIDFAEKRIKQIQEIINKTKEEEGVNKRIYDEQLERKRQAEADSKRISDAESERKKKELEEAKARADAEAEAVRSGEKNKEALKKYADLMKDIEQDRLANATKLSDLQDDQYLKEIETKLGSFERANEYARLEYENYAQYNERVINDEKSTNEQKRRSNENLYEAKRRLLELEKKGQIEAVETAMEIEELRSKQASAEIDRLSAKVKADIEVRKSEIKSLDISESEKRIKIKEIEADAQNSLDILDSLKDENSDTFSKIQESASESIIIIGKNFENQLLQLINKAKEGDKEITKDQTEEHRKRLSVFSSATSTTFSVLTTAFSNFKKNIVANVMNINNSLMSGVSDILATSDNDYAKAAGESVATSSTIANMMYSPLIAYGSKLASEWEAQKAQWEAESNARNQMYSNIITTLDMAIYKTEEWLGLLSKEDLSNLSITQLEEKKAGIYDQLAGQIGGDVTGKDYLTLKSLYKTRNMGGGTTLSEMEPYLSSLDSESYKKVKYYGNRGSLIGRGISYYDLNDDEKALFDASVEAGVFTDDEVKAMKRYAATMKGKPKADLYGTNVFDTMFSGESTPDEAQDIVSKIDELIAQKSAGVSGIDYTQSTTKEDFVADIGLQKDLGQLTEQQAAKLLYNASSDVNSKFYKDFAEDERTRYSVDYFNSLNGNSESGIIGLAEGGIALRPTLAMIAERGSPEAVVPLEKMESFVSMFLNKRSSGQIVKIEIENKIDPNIPITQDTAKMYSEQLGTRIETVLRGRGL